MADDDFKNLVPVSWRGIRFPFSELTTEFSHDMAEHKAPDVDGARLEATGRGVRTVTGKAIFRNKGLVFEPFKYARPWFPDIFREFEKACADRTTGDLVHPVRGKMRCKVVSFRDALTAVARDGVDVDVQWKEDGETDDANAKLTTLAAAATAAAALDLDMARLRALDAKFKVPLTFSFTDTLRSLQRAVDTASLIQRQFGGAFARMQRQLDNVTDSLDRLRDVSLVTIRTNAERMSAALSQYQRERIVGLAKRSFTVRVDMTVGALSKLLKTPVDELLVLNPSLASSAVVRASTVVVYPV